MQRNQYKFYILSACTARAFISPDALAQSSSFEKLQFGEAIFLEVQRNWLYLNEQIRQHLITGVEAIERLSNRPRRGRGYQAPNQVFFK